MSNWLNSTSIQSVIQVQCFKDLCDLLRFQSTCIELVREINKYHSMYYAKILQSKPLTQVFIKKPTVIDILDTGSRTCAPGTFSCESNRAAGQNVCLDQFMVCDGVRNCLLGEDEQQSCPPQVCQDSMFQCDNGLCIQSSWLCDHDNDCGDWSDEAHTCGSCLPAMFCLPDV